VAGALSLCLPAGADEIPPGAAAPDAELEIKTPLTDAEPEGFRGLEVFEVFVDRKRGTASPATAISTWPRCSSSARSGQISTGWATG